MKATKELEQEIEDLKKHIETCYKNFQTIHTALQTKGIPIAPLPRFERIATNTCTSTASPALSKVDLSK